MQPVCDLNTSGQRVKSKSSSVFHFRIYPEIPIRCGIGYLRPANPAHFGKHGIGVAKLRRVSYIAALFRHEQMRCRVAADR
jgi:hypothetical protein